MNNDSTAGRGLCVTACAIVAMASVAGQPAQCQSEEHAANLIGKYCAASWKNARIDRRDWRDCTQEAFVELLSRVSRNRLIEAIENAKSRERRELNRSIWCIVQRWRRAAHQYQLESDDVPDPRTIRLAHPDRDLTSEIIAMSRKYLNLRQQRILAKWLDGDSVAQIAASLDVSAARVSDEKYKAIRKLRSSLVRG